MAQPRKDFIEAVTPIQFGIRSRTCEYTIVPEYRINTTNGVEQQDEIKSETLYERPFHDSPHIVEDGLHAHHHPDDEPDESQGADKSENVVGGRRKDFVGGIEHGVDDSLIDIGRIENLLQFVRETETVGDSERDSDERHESHSAEIGSEPRSGILWRGPRNP